MLEKLRDLRGLIGSRVDHPLADSRELRRIVKEIPVDNAFRALDEIVGWLESASQAPDFPEDRLYLAVSQLDDAAQAHLRRLARDYLTSPRLSRTEEKRLWEINHGFWAVLAAAYERCLPPAGQRGKAGEQMREVLPAFSVRLISALGNLLKWQQFHYEPAAGSLWQRLGAALLAADEAGLAAQAVALRSRGTGVFSAQREYAKWVAFHAASMDGLLPLQIELGERLIAHFAGAFSFSPAVEHDSVYWVDLALPQPPLRMAQMPDHGGRTQRFFKPGAGHQGIERLLHALEKGGEVPAEINLGGQYYAPGLVPILRHLVTYLAPVPPQRRHPRHPVNQRVFVAHGMGDAHLAVAGRLAGQQDEARVESWVVENISRGGFGAVLHTVPGDWLKVGALIAMQPEGGAGWQVGVVRRFVRVGDTEARVGIEMLARWPEAVDLRVRAASSYSAAPGTPALLIAEGCPPGEIRAVLPHEAFDVREAMECIREGRRQLLTPVALIEAVADFDFVRYRLAAAG
jgi:hypothetical protein